MTRTPRIALGVATAALMILGASGPLYQLELLPLAAAYGGVVVAVILASAVLVWTSRFLSVARSHRGTIPAVATSISAVLTVFTISMPVRHVLRTRSAPPLHDITTDLQHPPVFRALDDVETPAQLARPTAVDALQKQVFPDIGPLTLPVPRAEAFEEVLETFAELDWPVADGDQDEGIIEATVRSPWFGFRDDMVVRLTPIGGQTRVDVRSVARDGRDDGGRNAEHVREFLEELRR